MTAPVPPAPVDELVEWLRQHRGSFTDEALRDRLRAAGHPEGRIDDAFAALDRAAAPAALGGPPPGGPVTARPGAPGTAPSGAWYVPPTAPPASPWDVALGYLGALAAIVGLPILLLMGRMDPNSAFFVGVAAFVFTVFGWATLRDSERRGFAKGFGYALITVIVLPVVAVVGIFGYCLVAGAQFA